MKYVITQEEFDDKITRAIDAALLPLIHELQALGVPFSTIDTAMKNAVAKELEKKDD